MPEGDTIHKAAAELRRALGDGPITTFETVRRVVGPRPRSGESIDRIRARGKHILIGFSGGATLHTHLRMNGSWRVTPLGRPTPRPNGHLRVSIVTPIARADCVAAPVVELLDAAALLRHPVLNALGPDLCEDHLDVDLILERAARLDPRTPIGVALLDQRVAAGIGNVYRSEVLWLCEVHPSMPLGALSEPSQRRLWRTAHEQLRRNLRPGPRRTVPEGLAVYERAGRACRRCGGRIEVRRLGEQARAAWWCPTCQTPP